MHKVLKLTVNQLYYQYQLYLKASIGAFNIYIKISFILIFQKPCCTFFAPYKTDLPLTRPSESSEHRITRTTKTFLHEVARQNWKCRWNSARFLLARDGPAPPVHKLTF